MTTNNKSDKFFAPQFMPGDGCAILNHDKFTLSVAPSVNDTIDFPLPAGMDLSLLELQFDDLDSNGTPTIAFEVGYAPIQANSQYTASPTYFAPAAQTTGKTGGRLPCSFKPIKFEEDMAIRITFTTAAATFAAGDVIAVMGGAAVGVK